LYVVQIHQQRTRGSRVLVSSSTLPDRDNQKALLGSELPHPFHDEEYDGNSEDGQDDEDLEGHGAFFGSIYGVSVGLRSKAQDPPAVVYLIITFRAPAKR
jgi:hypothetical protein